MVDFLRLFPLMQLQFGAVKRDVLLFGGSPRYCVWCLFMRIPLSLNQLLLVGKYVGCNRGGHFFVLDHRRLSQIVEILGHSSLAFLYDHDVIERGDLSSIRTARICIPPFVVEMLALTHFVVK